MGIDAMWVQVTCDKCGEEFAIELEADPRKAGSWRRNSDHSASTLAASEPKEASDENSG